jgi:hypothetical protein
VIFSGKVVMMPPQLDVNGSVALGQNLVGRLLNQLSAHLALPELKDHTPAAIFEIHEHRSVTGARSSYARIPYRLKIDIGKFP